MEILLTLMVQLMRYLMDMSNRTDRVFCSVCGGKTRLQIRGDTELKLYPLLPEMQTKHEP